MEDLADDSKDLLDDTSFKSVRRSSNFLSLFILFTYYTGIDLAGITILGTNIPKVVGHHEIMVMIWIAWGFIFWRYYQHIHARIHDLTKAFMNEYFKTHFSYKILANTPNESEISNSFPTDIKFWNMFKNRPSEFKKYDYSISDISLSLEGEIMGERGTELLYEITTDIKIEQMGKITFFKFDITKSGYKNIVLSKFISSYFIFPLKHPRIVSLYLPYILAFVLWAWTIYLWSNDRLYLIWLEWF